MDNSGDCQVSVARQMQQRGQQTLDTARLRLASRGGQERTAAGVCTCELTYDGHAKPTPTRTRDGFRRFEGTRASGFDWRGLS